MPSPIIHQAAPTRPQRPSTLHRSLLSALLARLDPENAEDDMAMPQPLRPVHTTQLSPAARARFDRFDLATAFSEQSQTSEELPSPYDDLSPTSMPSGWSSGSSTAAIRRCFESYDMSYASRYILPAISPISPFGSLSPRTRPDGTRASMSSVSSASSSVFITCIDDLFETLSPLMPSLSFVQHSWGSLGPRSLLPEALKSAAHSSKSPIDSSDVGMKRRPATRGPKTFWADKAPGIEETSSATKTTWSSQQTSKQASSGQISESQSLISQAVLPDYYPTRHKSRSSRCSSIQPELTPLYKRLEDGLSLEDAIRAHIYAQELVQGHGATISDVRAPEDGTLEVWGWLPMGSWAAQARRRIVSVVHPRRSMAVTIENEDN